MQKKKIVEIQNLAHGIDCRINLFQGFSPKEADSDKGELLFWKQVVTLYGLFADCDRFQVKEKKNLIELMKRYSLIEKEDYDIALKFWRDVSELRKWFCHNNDVSLYYAKNRERNIKNYLNRVFLLASNKPQEFKDILPKDWTLLTYDLDRRFLEYLQILEKGLLAWKESNDLKEIIDEWIVILANALFTDKELIQNVLVEIAIYEKNDEKICNMSTSHLVNFYFKQLESLDFSVRDVENELKRENTIIRTNKEIMLECIRNIRLI